MCTGKYLIWTANFWGAVAFHAVTGIIGIFLVTKAVPYRGKEEEKDDSSIGDGFEEMAKKLDSLDSENGILETIDEEIKKEEKKSGKDGGEES